MRNLLSGIEIVVSRSAQKGNRTMECVMLRCHSMMERGLCANGPANTSMSGNMAPRVHAAIATLAVGELKA